VNKQFISKITGPQTDAGRRVEDLTHNRTGKLVRQIVNGRTETEVRYDTGARAEISTNARGFTTHTVTNEYDQVTQIIHPDGSMIKRQYSPLHLRVTEKTDAGGVRVQLLHDARGNLVKEIEAPGTEEERSTEYELNERGQVTQLTRKGRHEATGTITPDASWVFQYDAFGEMSQSIDPEGHVRRYTHDRLGKQTEYTDPRGYTTRFEYAADGNMLKVTNALGQMRSAEYSRNGTLIAVTDARQKQSRVMLDALDRRMKVIGPD